MICQCRKILWVNLSRRQVKPLAFFAVHEAMAYTFPLSPLGVCWGPPWKLCLLPTNFCSICVWTSWTEPSLSQQSLRLWGGGGSFILPRDAQSFCSSLSQATILLLPSLPPHRFLERFQPPGKEPVMRGGKRGGRRMRGLDGYTGSDPDISTGGGVMLCLFLTLCSDRDRSTETGWKVSGGRSVLEMDTTFLQAAGRRWNLESPWQSLNISLWSTVPHFHWLAYINN